MCDYCTPPGQRTENPLPAPSTRDKSNSSAGAFPGPPRRRKRAQILNFPHIPQGLLIRWSAVRICPGEPKIKGLQAPRLKNPLRLYAACRGFQTNPLRGFLPSHPRRTAPYPTPTYRGASEVRSKAFSGPFTQSPQGSNPLTRARPPPSIPLRLYASQSALAQCNLT